MFETPVLFIVFNRPETTAKVFEKIKQIKPKYLFISADGPRKDNESDLNLYKEVRKIATNVDWDCELKTLFRDENLGCGRAVSSGIDWFFENVEQGIILEDDCLPDLSFFNFCEELLYKYKTNQNIFEISGTNIVNERSRDNSYYFSKYGGIWGWATWKRAWEKYKFIIDDKREIFEKINKVVFDKEVKKYWFNVVDKLVKREIDTWDYQWLFTIWLNNGLCIVPNKNLITNIGFNENATHTSNNSKLANLKLEPNLLVEHPKKIKQNKQNDKNFELIYIAEKHGVIYRFREKLFRINLKIKYFVKRVMTKIFIKLININEIEKAIAENRINNCLSQVSIGENSRFYEQAEINNFQNNKNNIVIGENTHIRGKLLIFANGGKIVVGDNCYIGENTNIWSAENIKIGSNVLISDHVHIIDTNSHEIDHIERAENFKKMIQYGHPKEKENILTKSIIIEDDVWISYNVSILKGVKIGKGAIVSAASVVTKDVPSFCVVAGNPAIIKKKLKND